MKRLLLPIMLVVSSNAYSEIRYNKETGMYYSTKATQFINAERYHCHAEYANFLLEDAMNEGIDIKEVIKFIKEHLMFDGTYEAMLLLDDLMEIWK